MNTATLEADRTPATSVPRTERWLLPGVAALALLAWAVSRAGLFRAGDDAGYWLGVAGGVMMLVLFLYPARKYMRALRNAGHVKGWFVLHMVCGIAGPWLIVVHSTLRIGSLNAGVALVSMLIVVASGVVGRFLFVRVQHRLGDGQARLQQQRDRLGLAGSEARSAFAFAPEVDARLRAFEARELPPQGPAAIPLPRLLGVPLRRWREERRCVALLHERLAAAAQRHQWDGEQLALRRRRTTRLLARYFDAVVQVAHFSLFDRLFALWHVAHLPFVVLLVISAVVHVVAVHAY